MSYKQYCLAATICCAATVGLAQETTGQPATQPQAPPPACDTPEHRQFDFWVGQWDVYANDQLAGTNRIELRHNNCVLHESWTSAAGNFSGNSINLYDARNKRWHQSWADSSGALLQMDGGLEGENMVLSGKVKARQGDGMVMHRITWTPNENGTVRQHWQSSQDDGATWSTLFDGEYRRK